MRGSLARGIALRPTSVGGNAPFGQALQTPLELPLRGEVFGAYGRQPQDMQWPPYAAMKAGVAAWERQGR
jgi:hypothetical protein